MYKQFRIRNGKLYPLFVRCTDEIPIGEWVLARDGERKTNGYVKSRLGNLAYRPGFHLAEIPLAKHIGIKDENGKIRYAHPDTVWAECEVQTDVNYNGVARNRGMRNGKYDAKKAYLDYIPVNGYYEYRTNPKMIGKWIITGGLRVDHILTYEEEETICQKFGLHAQERKGCEI